MANRQARERGWRLAIKRIAATRGASWLFSHILHHVDHPLLRLSHGRWSATGLLTGLPVVTLTMTGARSRLPRSLPLVGLEDGDRVVLIASNFGRSRHPAWYYNLRANPEVTLALRERKGTYIAREATPAEHEVYWRSAVAHYGGFVAYQQRAERVARRIPILVLTPKHNND
jgi:deazaflavin-dependent oxidoreductase (nitroreductase family)